MFTVSARVLKDELSSYLQRAESGEEIVVVNDGRPVAALVPLSRLQGATEQQRLAELASHGLVVLPRRTDRAAFKGPVFPCRDKLVSYMVVEDRS
jgi:prevent-host-death family protein